LRVNVPYDWKSLAFTDEAVPIVIEPLPWLVKPARLDVRPAAIVRAPPLVTLTNDAAPVWLMIALLSVVIPLRVAPRAYALKVAQISSRLLGWAKRPCFSANLVDVPERPRTRALIAEANTGLS
jgi:hypothetical protein